MPRTPAPPADLVYNTAEEINKAHEELRASFLSGVTRDVAFRKHQLKQLSNLLKDNTELIAEAVFRDLGRCRFESVFAEIVATQNSVVEAVNNVSKWSKDERVWAGPVWAAHRPVVRKEPKGTVLVLGAWNYPISVQVGAMIGALAAGCTTILKPSEVSAHSAKLLAELWPKYMDPAFSRIINGGVTETTQLLDLRWEHIFYTGNGTVGRIVAEKAAKWLCPVSLELGGKSPVFVDETTDLSIAANRILWSKSLNCGQTCIAPDYILVTEKAKDKLVAELEKSYKKFWPEGVENSEDYGRIVNDRHWSRLDDMLSKTQGTIAIGGTRAAEQRLIVPTIVTDVQGDDSTMAGEIFGPILPMMTIKDIDEGIDFVNSHDQPLSLYVFSDKHSDKIVNRTQSGGVVRGDLLIHYVIPGTPFGGTGPSGYGSYHGKAGFDTYTHQRTDIRAPVSGPIGKSTELAMSSRYPPYSSSKLKQFMMLVAKNPSYAKSDPIYKNKKAYALPQQQEQKAYAKPIPKSSAVNGGANGHANGYANGHANGYANGHANGHANRHANGHANGDAKAYAATNATAPAPAVAVV